MAAEFKGQKRGQIYFSGKVDVKGCQQSGEK
jgi:hypothetical protein